MVVLTMAGVLEQRSSESNTLDRIALRVYNCMSESSQIRGKMCETVFCYDKEVRRIFFNELGNHVYYHNGKGNVSQAHRFYIIEEMALLGILHAVCCDDLLRVYSVSQQLSIMGSKEEEPRRSLFSVGGCFVDGSGREERICRFLKTCAGSLDFVIMVSKLAISVLRCEKEDEKLLHEGLWSTSLEAGLCTILQDFTN